MTIQSTSRRQWRRNAIALAASAIVLALPGFDGAYAQSTTVGSVFGQISATANSQVVVESAATGVKRTVPVGSDGRFQVGALPPGRYRVTLIQDGKTASTVETDVLAGQGAEAVFTSGSGTQTVVVTGRIARLDVSSSVNASVFTARQLDAIPVATRDLNGIIALAANTVRADSRYAGGISIGGGAPSENAYYINGFPVTNALTQLGSIELPFGAIQQAQVQTGGFGAEFGRSVGGVVNIVTKSGTNEWHGGVGISVEPNSLRSKARSSYYGNVGIPSTDGTVYTYRDGNKRDQTIGNAYVGGPLIKDKLFLFVAADQTKTDQDQVNSTPQASSRTSTGWRESSTKDTRYLAKFDWYLTDDHRLEATFLGDNFKTTDDYFGYDFATHAKTGYSYTQNSKNLANVTPGVGGEAQILRYTGNITKDLLISALYGESSSKHKQTYNFAASAPQILVANRATDVNPNFAFPAITSNPLPGGTTGIPNGAEDKTKSLRFDVEYTLGSHTLRAGIDENKLKSLNAGDSYSNVGGSYIRYSSTANGGFTGPAGAPNARSLIAAGAVPVNGRYYYVRERVFSDVTNADSDQSAQYIEDRWQATKDLLLTLGLRNEGFKNKNGDGQTFLKMDSFVAPRFAAAWDVLGDASTKVFGSAGRYSLQIPTHVAVRGASRSTFTDTYRIYTGIDPVTGAPTGTTAFSGPFSTNNEYGQAKDPRSVSATKLKPTYQDEITLGIEKSLTRSLVGGAKVTYRRLGDTIDDFCDQRPIDRYAAAHNIDDSNYGGFNCASINPGKANTLLVDYSGTGNFVTVPLSAADIGLPKAKRTYTAFDFFLEHPLSDGWYAKVTYTWSQSKGNTEGQTRSDNAQTDVAATSTWDNPEVMEGSYGYLPNDRRHQVKGYGYYQFTQEWAVGSSLTAESGRPKNCFGDYAGPGQDPGYSGTLFYCNGAPSPRGSAGRTPLSFALDLNGVYKPAALKGLSLRADVFNLFNRQSAQVVDEVRESNSTYTNTPGIGFANPGYGRVISYSAPRKVRLTASYDF